MIKIILSSFKKRGIIETLKFIVYELSFDLKYNTKTAGYIELDSLDIINENKEHGCPYQASNYYLLKIFFEKFKDKVNNSVFLDFGSGKGRVLFLSALYGAKKAIGVEFSKELVEICHGNIENFQKKSKTKNELKVLHQDASEYVDIQDIDIFFFYNPFDDLIMRKVLTNIITFGAKNKEILLVYVNPVHRKLFNEYGFKTIYSYNNDLLVYSN